MKDEEYEDLEWVVTNGLMLDKITAWEVCKISREDMLREMIDNIDLRCSYHKLDDLEKLYILETKKRELLKKVSLPVRVKFNNKGGYIKLVLKQKK